MNQTIYRAVQVSGPGQLELVELPLKAPSAGQVRIRVEACGICHTDSYTVEGLFPGLQFPKVPGHEVVGTIDAIGDGVREWRIGQRVGVGFMGGHCGSCTECRKGHFGLCKDQPLSGITVDGGWAEVMIAKANGLVAVPDGINSIDAAPFLCAGTTTFNALRNSQARPGDLVAIQGIGGLGHLAIQFARKMGLHVVAIARGEEKRALSTTLGAHRYIDSAIEDPVAVLQSMGGAAAIVATVPTGAAMSPLVEGLRPRGRLIVVGDGPDPITVSTQSLLGGGMRAIEGSIAGSVTDAEEGLAFSVLQEIRPMIEEVTLEGAAEAYAKMMRNEARFRMVLTPLQSST